MEIDIPKRDSPITNNQLNDLTVKIFPNSPFPGH